VQIWRDPGGGGRRSSPSPLFADLVDGDWIRRRAAKSWRSGESLASCGGGPWMGSAGPWMGSPSLSAGFPFFYSIYRGGHPTASENVPFTVTFPPRRLRCPSRLIVFARLGKVFCSSENDQLSNKRLVDNNYCYG
jgi:hypothetical protein